MYRTGCTAKIFRATRPSRTALVLGALPLVWSLPLAAQQDSGQTPSGGTAHALEISLSDDTLEARYLRDVGFQEVGPTAVSGGIFFNESRDLVASVGALSRVTAPSDTQRLVVSIGGRVYGAWLNAEDEDVLGLGLGGEVKYYLGADREIAVSLTGFYAPDIVMFGEADNLSDASLRIEARLRRGITVFVGYRALEIDLAVDRELDDNVHVGFRRQF